MFKNKLEKALAINFGTRNLKQIRPTGMGYYITSAYIRSINDDGQDLTEWIIFVESADDIMKNWGMHADVHRVYLRSDGVTYKIKSRPIKTIGNNHYEIKAITKIIKDMYSKKHNPYKELAKQ